MYQLLGAVAILVGLVGTWLAAKHRTGWLLCVTSSTMWFPALVTGDQWAAVANCALSIAICARNFHAQANRSNQMNQMNQTDQADQADKTPVQGPERITLVRPRAPLAVEVGQPGPY